MTTSRLATLLLLSAGGGLIGFLLSVLGAGGSILLLPLLVSGAALPSREAVPLSLLVVTLLALANGPGDRLWAAMAAPRGGCAVRVASPSSSTAAAPNSCISHSPATTSSRLSASRR